MFNPTKREDVYAAIDSERAYQDYRWNSHKHSLEEWAVYIENYLNEAKTQLSRNPQQVGDVLALDTFRKITAMGVAAMEQHGAPKRDYGS